MKCRAPEIAIDQQDLRAVECKGDCGEAGNRTLSLAWPGARYHEDFGRGTRARQKNRSPHSAKRLRDFGPRGNTSRNRELPEFLGLEMICIHCRNRRQKRQLKTLLDVGHGFEVGIQQFKQDGQAYSDEESAADAERFVEISSRVAGEDRDIRAIDGMDSGRVQTGNDTRFLEALLKPVVQHAIGFVITMSKFVLHRLLAHPKRFLLLFVEGVAKLPFIASGCIQLFLESR